MNRESDNWRGAREAAISLFDGNTEKADKLLLLLEAFASPTNPPAEFLNLVMNLPEYDCHWCTDEGECWFNIPDSLFRCNGKCKDYEEKEKNDHKPS